jgi:hypothetical protein
VQLSLRQIKKAIRFLLILQKKTEGNVIALDDDQHEDLAPGSLMDQVKTGNVVSRDSIMLMRKEK